MGLRSKLRDTKYRGIFIASKLSSQIQFENVHEILSKIMSLAKPHFEAKKRYKNSIFQKSSCGKDVSERIMECLSLVTRLIWKSRDTKYRGICLASKVRSQNQFEDGHEIRSKITILENIHFQAKKR